MLKQYRLIGFIAAILILIPVVAFGFTPSGFLEIHYINVGWGQSILVIGPNGTTLLIDGGRDNMGVNDVIPYMESINLMPADGLRYIMASHLHSDHIAGLTEVMNNGYDVHTAVYYNGSNNSNSYVTAFSTAASHTSAGPKVTLLPGTVIQLGGGATATCVCANGTVWGHGPVSGAQSDENDRSIGLLIEYYDFAYLCAGDMGGGDSDFSCTGRSTGQVNVETPMAQAILPGGEHPLLNAYGVEAIHVNHHGSESSMNPDYMNLLTPRIACIATGSGQSPDYQFPRHDVVDHVLRAGVSCITVPGATVLQNEEGQPTGSLTSYAGYCIGDIVIKTNGQRLFLVSGSGRLHEGPDERAALGLPRYYPMDEDTSDHILPGAISNLSATGGPGGNQITLHWTASGDDGTTGQAALYDTRYVLASNGPINTEAKWTAATKISSLPYPKTSGLAESLIVSALVTGQSYYFAMKTTDDNLNLSALSNSPQGTAGLASGVLAGVVTDIRGVVTGVIVTASDGLGHIGIDTTDAGGSYSLTLTPGTYGAAFTQINHRDTTRTSIVVTSGNTITVNMVMARLKGSISGIVSGNGSGAIAGVHVAIVNLSKEDTTAADGYYLLGDLVDSSYSISLSHANYRDTSVSGLIVTPGQITTLNMVMQKMPGWLGGTITDTAGAPIESVLIRINAVALKPNQNNKEIHPPNIMLSGGSLILSNDSIYSDSEGQYLTMIPWNTYNISFTRFGYRDTIVTGVAVAQNDTAVLSLSMQSINYPPVIQSPAIDTAIEHIQFRYVAVASDPDDTTLLIDITDYPSWLAVQADTIFGIPPQGVSDTTFRIIASDGELADTLIVALKVIMVNDPPQITSPDSAVATEHQAFSYVATAIDPDSTTPSITYRNYAGWLHVNGAEISGIPPESAADTSFKVIASDEALADTQIVRVRVIRVNDPPVIISPDSVVATEHQLFSHTVTAIDPEGLTPIIVFGDYASWLHVFGSTISGALSQHTTDTSFMVIASDGALADTQLVSIRVILINDPPVITSSDSATAICGLPFVYASAAIDPEGENVFVIFMNYPGWLSAAGPTLSGIPPVGSFDTTFWVVASDGQISDTLLVFLTVKSNCNYLLGDINGDGQRAGGDVIFGVRYFKGIGNPPSDSCYLDSTGAFLYVSGDCNGNCEFRGSDITRLVAYFKGSGLLSYCHFFPTLPLRERRRIPSVSPKY